MKDFRDGKYQILVSTTVVEVGVDIPNATVVLIEGANRFGLAQLHQIRGRVGRRDIPSYCVLIPDKEDAADNERLQAMTKTNDGFKLADFDLQQRGPGEFLGSRQSGYVSMRFASVTDISLIERCRTHTLNIIKSDANLEEPEHQLLKTELTYHWPELQLN
jgi:ATP-dependent DNA helicase RecG